MGSSHQHSPLSPRGLRHFLRRCRAEAQGTEISEWSPPTVHRWRRNCKRLRAWLRIVREIWTTAQFREWDQRIRDLGKTLSAERDRWIIAQVWGEVAEGQVVRPELVVWVNEQLTQKSPANSEVLSPGEFLERWGAVVKELRRETKGMIRKRVIRAGLERTYRQAAEGYQECRDAAARPQDFHRWRRAVKNLYFQVRWDVAHFCRGRSRLQQLKRLEVELGEGQDLWVTQQFLESQRPANSDDQETLRRILRELRKEIKRGQRHALRSGRRLLQESPRTFRRTWLN